VDISFKADAARAKRFEERNASLVIVVRMDGHRHSATDEVLPVSIPYQGAIAINVLAECYVIRVVWYADPPGLKVLNPDELENTTVEE
jgi:hypothetical protein